MLWGVCICWFLKIEVVRTIARTHCTDFVSSVSQPYRTGNRMIFCLTSGSRVLIFRLPLCRKGLRRVAADQNPEQLIIS